MDQNEPIPLVSIVTPVYNAERFLARTLQSVQAQTYSNWEQLLVIDWNSSDRSFEIATEFAQRDARFRVFRSETNLGVARNRNTAIDQAQGDYIAFLDADDLWLPAKLERQIQFMASQKLSISCHHYQPINENDEPLGPQRNSPLEIDFRSLLKDNSMGCLTVTVRKDFLKNHRFPEIKHEDLALWLELLKEGAKAKALQECLALYRIQSTSLSGNKLKSAVWRWKIYQHLQLPILTSASYLAFYMFSAIKKRI